MLSRNPLTILLLAVAYVVHTQALGEHTNVLGGESKNAVPAFLWSGKNVLDGHNNVYKGLDGIHQNELVEAVKGELLGYTDTKEKVTGEIPDLKNPKAVVVFLTDRLGITDVSKESGAYGDGNLDLFIRKAILEANSSVVFPYTKLFAHGVRSPWSKLAGDLEAEEKVTAVIIGAEDINGPDFPDKLPAGKDGNGKHFILVHVGEKFNAQADVLMRRVCDQMTDVLGEDYVALLTGMNEAAFDNSKKEKAKDEIPVTVQSRILKDDANDYKIRNSPHLMSGMLISLMLLLATSVYICCLDCVETPASYASRYPMKGKEFN